MGYKYRYDSEADVLAYFLSKKPFVHAREVGDFIVHFAADESPVYIEILNASQFLMNAVKTLPRSKQFDALHRIAAA